MRGKDIDRSEEVAEVSPSALVPEDHPLRPMRETVDAVLAEMSSIFDSLLEILARRLRRQFKTVRDVGRAIARLGGHMSGPPGWKTLWEGWLELQAMAAGAMLILQMRGFEE